MLQGLKDKWKGAKTAAHGPPMNSTCSKVSVGLMNRKMESDFACGHWYPFSSLFWSLQWKLLSLQNFAQTCMNQQCSGRTYVEGNWRSLSWGGCWELALHARQLPMWNADDQIFVVSSRVGDNLKSTKQIMPLFEKNIVMEQGIVCKVVWDLVLCSSFLWSLVSNGL